MMRQSITFCTGWVQISGEFGGSVTPTERGRVRDPYTGLRPAGGVEV
jgi:hypothetical protein